jgi:hypothetical protein
MTPGSMERGEDRQIMIKLIPINNNLAERV